MAEVVFLERYGNSVGTASEKVRYGAVNDCFCRVISRPRTAAMSMELARPVTSEDRPLQRRRLHFAIGIVQPIAQFSPGYRWGYSGREFGKNSKISVLWWPNSDPSSAPKIPHGTRSTIHTEMVEDRTQVIGSVGARITIRSRMPSAAQVPARSESQVPAPCPCRATALRSISPVRLPWKNEHRARHLARAVHTRRAGSSNASCCLTCAAC